MSSWKENIRSYNSLLEEKEFRNKVHAITASSIGGQFFCEKKVDLDYVHGEIETPEKSEGTALHAELLAMKKATIDKIIEGIEQKEIYGASFPMVARFDDVVLSGIADAVVFQRGKPRYVIELKTTRGDTTFVFDGQKAQADVYGLLLDQIGFDCSNLKIVIVKFKKESALTGKQKQKFLSVLLKSLLSSTHEKFAVASKNEIVVHLFDYKRESSINVIGKTKGYWLKQREPIPTTSPRKCMACEFKKICPSSLSKD